MQRYCETRDVELRNQLVQEHLYIAEIVAKRYVGRGVEYDDLFQVASMALIGALERFDCTKEIQFSSFAVPTLTGVVKNYFRDKSRAIRVPRRLSESLKKIKDAKDGLTQELQRQPDASEIAQRTGMKLEDVIESLEAQSIAQVGSLDAFVGPDDDMELSKLLGEEEEEYERIAVRDLLEKELAMFNEMERHILLKRYVAGQTQRQIASELGVSQMYVSRMERKLLGRLRLAFSEVS